MPTYSDIAKKLSLKKAKFEKLGESYDPAKKFTSERMKMKFDTQLDNLFNVQELLKPVDNTQVMEKGGKLKYQKGGNPLIESLKRSYLGRGLSAVSDFITPDYYNLPPKTGKLFEEGSFEKYIPSEYQYMLPSNSSYEFQPKPFDQMGLRGKVQPLGINNSLVPELSISNVPTNSNIPSNKSTNTQSTTKPVREDIDLDSLPTASKKLPFGLTPKFGGVNFKTNGVNLSKPTSKSGGQNEDVNNPPSSFQDKMLSMAPFLDNFANLINPTPQIPTPDLMRVANLETNYNVSPQINEARRGLRNFNESVNRSTGQANTSAAYKGKALADYFRHTGDILGQKENIETNLRNQQAQNIAQTDNMNTQITNNFKNQQVARSESERMRRIGLMSNLGEDFMTIRNDKKMQELDKDKFGVLAEFFKDVIQSSPGLKNRKEFNKFGGKLKMKSKK